MSKLISYPDFINIGPGRCATSWLFERLSEHPEISMALVKETEYFNVNFYKGEQWYRKHFLCNKNVKVGEISNNYYLDPEVAVRILDHNPNTKIIINIRNPYTLLQSYYDFGLRRGLTLGSLNEALECPIGKIMGSGYDDRLLNGTLAETDQHSLIESVLLAKHLSPFFSQFPPSQVYVLIFERLANEKEKVLKEIYDFLDVDCNYTSTEATTIVNDSIKPRSTTIARFSSSLAYFLRKYQLYKILTLLHKSRLIKKLLYTKSEKANHTLDQALPIEVRKVIDCEIQKLLLLHPKLSQYWQT